MNIVVAVLLDEVCSVWQCIVVRCSALQRVVKCCRVVLMKVVVAVLLDKVTNLHKHS